MIKGVGRTEDPSSATADWLRIVTEPTRATAEMTATVKALAAFGVSLPGNTLQAYRPVSILIY
jgi:hypothetical protein